MHFTFQYYCIILQNNAVFFRVRKLIALSNGGIAGTYNFFFFLGGGVGVVLNAPLQG